MKFMNHHHSLKVTVVFQLLQFIFPAIISYTFHVHPHYSCALTHAVTLANCVWSV